jgi:hypothetical protein
MPSYVTALRTTRITAVLDAIDAGAAGLLKIYTGTSPGVNSAATGTLLVTLTFSDPAGTVSNGVLTFSAVTAGTAVADGTAGYARITTSAGATVADLTVGATGSGAEIELNNVNIVTGGEVSLDVSGGISKITEGNA